MAGPLSESPAMNHDKNSRRPTPQVSQLLSNGRYHVMVTNAGGGNSHGRTAVTRWREDATRTLGHVLLPPRRSGRGVLVDRAPAHVDAADHYEAIFETGGVTSYRESRFRHAYRDRRVTRGRRRDAPRSHHESVALAAQRSTSPAMPRSCSRRTPRTSSIPPSATFSCRPRSCEDRTASFATRRPRSREEHVPWMFHLMTLHGADHREISFETDRMRFIGRGRSASRARRDGRPRQPLRTPTAPCWIRLRPFGGGSRSGPDPRPRSTW